MSFLPRATRKKTPLSGGGQSYEMRWIGNGEGYGVVDGLQKLGALQI